MKHSTRLADLLQSTFDLHRARLTCLAALVIALFRVKTVQSGPTRHRLSGYCRDRLPLPAPATLLPIPPPSTCARGHLRARFSTRRPLYPGARPNPVDAWQGAHQLPRPVRRPRWHRLSSVFSRAGQTGNSNTQERIDLLGQVLTLLGSDKIDCLVADREFIGAEWFAWLKAHHISFCIRIRHDMKVSRTTGALSPAHNFFRSLPRATSCCLIGPRLVCGHWLWLSGMHLPTGAYPQSS